MIIIKVSRGGFGSRAFLVASGILSFCLLLHFSFVTPFIEFVTATDSVVSLDEGLAARDISIIMISRPSAECIIENEHVFLHIHLCPDGSEQLMVEPVFVSVMARDGD